MRTIPSLALASLTLLGGCYGHSVKVVEQTVYDDAPISSRDDRQPGAWALDVEQPAADGRAVTLRAERVRTCTVKRFATVDRTARTERTLSGPNADKVGSLWLYGALGLAAGTGATLAGTLNPDWQDLQLDKVGPPVAGVGLVLMGNGAYYSARSADSTKHLGVTEVVVSDETIECERVPVAGARIAIEGTPVAGTTDEAGTWTVNLANLSDADLRALAGAREVAIETPEGRLSARLDAGSLPKLASVEASARELAATRSALTSADPKVRAAAEAALKCTSTDASKLDEALRLLKLSTESSGLVFVDTKIGAVSPVQPSLLTFGTGPAGEYHVFAFTTRYEAPLSAIVEVGDVTRSTRSMWQGTAEAVTVTHGLASQVTSVSFTAGRLSDAAIVVSGYGCYGVSVFWKP